MSGLLRRLTRRRGATADETRPQTPAASEPVDAPASAPGEPGGERPVPDSEQPTAAHDLPAGVDPAALAARPGEGARRGSVRRRVRYLRAVRELLLRDLGGFSYELHRTAGGTAGDAHRPLLEAKAARLAALDGEVRELEAGLGEPHPDATVLRRPGIGGTCPECGELHGSEAAFCWHCGMPVTERAVRRRAMAPPPAGGHGVVPSGARRAAMDEHPTAERLALWIKSSAGEARPAPGAGEQAPAQPAPAPAAEPAEAAAEEPAPAAPERAAKKPPEDAPADEQPAAAKRPAEGPGGPSDGDPLATPGERRS